MIIKLLENSQTLVSIYVDEANYNDLAIAVQENTGVVKAVVKANLDSSLMEKSVIADSDYIYSEHSTSGEQCLDNNNAYDSASHFLIFDTLENYAVFASDTYLSYSYDSVVYNASVTTVSGRSWIDAIGDEDLEVTGDELDRLLSVSNNQADLSDSEGTIYRTKQYLNFITYTELEDISTCTGAGLSLDNMPDLPTASDWVAPNLGAVPSL